MNAKSADAPPPPTPITSELEVVEEETSPTESSLSVENITEIFTEWDTGLSEESSEDSLTEIDPDSESRQPTGIVFESVILENITKAKDGGWSVVLSVSEMDSKAVGELVASIQTVFQCALMRRSDH